MPLKQRLEGKDMNIAIDASTLNEKNRAGVSEYAYQLIKEFAKVSDNLYTLYFRQLPDKELIQELIGDNKNMYVKVVESKRFWTQVGLAKELNKSQFDIFFSPRHTLPILTRKTLKKVVVIHDVGYGKYHSVFKKSLFNLSTMWALRVADKVIAVSSVTKQKLLENYNIKEEKVSVVYEGVDYQFFQSTEILRSLALSQNDVEKMHRHPDFPPVIASVAWQSKTAASGTPRSDEHLRHSEVIAEESTISEDLSQIKNKYNLNNNYIFFIGTIQPRKNLKNQFKAFKNFIEQNKINDLEFVVAGANGWKYQDILDCPKKLGIENKVKFIGRVDDKDLTLLFKGAKFTTFVSKEEGFGLPILQSMASGTAVITSNVSSMPEVAGESAILADPTSINAITKGYKELYFNDALREDLRQSGLKRVLMFTWQKTAESTLQIFSKL